VLGRLKFIQQIFVTEPSTSESEVTIGKLERYKSPGSDQIPAELTQVGGGGGTLHSEMHHKLIKVTWNKEELPHQWSQMSYIFTKR
jgi:hypothetical protein